MVQITGKYELTKSENFAEHLVSMGVPKENAEKIEKAKGIHEFTHKGNNITLDIHVEPKYNVELVLNQEVEERFSADETIKTTAQLVGDTLTLKSKYSNGKTETKIHTFTDSGFTVVFQDEDPATPDAVRVFKRL